MKKLGLKFTILKTKIMASIWSHHLVAIDGETMETVTDFILRVSKITADGDCSHEIKTHSAFFIVQLSHPYTTTGKTTAVTRRTFVGKVMYLLFNMLSRLS